MPIRVLAVAQSSQPGGAELSLLRLLPPLRDDGFDIELAVPAEGGVASAARGQGIRVCELSVGPLRSGGWPRAALAWPRTRRTVRRAAPDAVLLNGMVTQRLVPALGATPALLYLHDMVDRRPRPWGSERFWARVPRVACASQAMARTALAAGAPADRLHTVYEPVTAPQPVPRPDWADGRPIVGFVGRLEPRKAPLDLLEAVPELLRRRPDARIVLVAGPQLEDTDEAYQAAVRARAADLGGSVLVLDPVPDGAALMSWFDVLAVPSRAEPFGTVAAEALAAGTPAVVTDSGGMPEYVVPGRNGDVVPVGDSGRMAAALDAVLARGGEMADAARQDAARFSTAEVAAAVGRLLRQTAGR